MKNAYIVFFLLITGCKLQKGLDSPAPELTYDPPTNQIADYLKSNDPSMDIYQNEFIALADDYNSTMFNKPIYSIQKNLIGRGLSILGQCLVYDDANLIVVDSTFWANASDFNRRSVIFHELGHCLLGRPHKTIFYQGLYKNYGSTISPDWDFMTHPNWPLSLMHNTYVKQDQLKSEFDYYIRELFGEGGGVEANYNCSYY
jgi:hypothetical protein